MTSKEKRRNKCVTEQQVMDLICGHNGHSQNAKDFGCSYFFLAFKKSLYQMKGHYILKAKYQVLSYSKKNNGFFFILLP